MDPRKLTEMYRLGYSDKPVLDDAPREKWEYAAWAALGAVILWALVGLERML